MDGGESSSNSSLVSSCCCIPNLTVEWCDLLSIGYSGRGLKNAKVCIANSEDDSIIAAEVMRTKRFNVMVIDLFHLKNRLRRWIPYGLRSCSTIAHLIYRSHTIGSEVCTEIIGTNVSLPETIDNKRGQSSNTTGCTAFHRGVSSIEPSFHFS